MAHVQTKNKTDFYLILKNANWLSMAPNILQNTLIKNADHIELAICVAYTSMDKLLYIIADTKYDFQVNDAIEQAYENLNNAEVVFRPNKGIPQALTANIGELSSEIILSKKHMTQAQRLLNTQELLVSIARSSHIMIIDKNASKDVLKRFVQEHHSLYEDKKNENALLTPSIIIVKDGEIKDIFSMQELET